MSAKTTKVKLDDTPPEYKIGNRWMNHSTIVTLTPDKTDAKGTWSSPEDRGSDINSSSGTPHAKYEWNRGEHTLELVLEDFTTGDSSKKLPPETVLVLDDFDNLMGTKGGGVFMTSMGKSSYRVTWEVVVGLKASNEEKDDDNPVPQIAMGDVKSIYSYNKGAVHVSEMEGRDKYNTDGNIGIALYDRKNGKVILQVFGPRPAGRGQPRKIIYEGEIGSVEIPAGKNRFGYEKTPTQIGDEVEEPVRDLVRKATGQNFPWKRSNAHGPDLTTPKR
jgi:hypothetical protein